MSRSGCRRPPRAAAGSPWAMTCGTASTSVPKTSAERSAPATARRRTCCSMMRAAHRFGIRVYFDNIMNHNAFDIPGYNESTPIDVYPGIRAGGFPPARDRGRILSEMGQHPRWGDAWQVQNLGLSDLIDIATEPGDWNNNFGRSEGDDASARSVSSAIPTTRSITVTNRSPPARSTQTTKAPTSASAPATD